MAWVSVLTDDGEEVARFEVQPDRNHVWGYDLERQIGGVIGALDEAIEKDERRRAARPR